ncbi:class I SAM-dependent methyltransferase [Microbispora sp. H10949]|uniref:class I SAM-dependent methyltransferase n=1 Tax=Microbispora sp. H10949 TaxID=2729111 RepID=UPI001602579B|nr:class I SAM-dependent methyltransferase [Microbispora sp. H10949]
MVIVNSEQAAAWNGYEGEHWASHRDRYDAVNSGFNDALLGAAAIGEHDHVLDLGCGNGQVTRLAARRAGSGGATGVDLSEPMLRTARLAALREGVGNVTFERGDVQVHPFPDAAFDVAVSRFGVMFFADPVAAFANVRRALRPGGRLAFLSLRQAGSGDLEEVFAAVAEHVPALRPAEAGSGPASLADPDRVRDVLAAAGFRDAGCAPVTAPQIWGRDAADAAEFLGGWGPVRHHLRAVDDTSAARALDALETALRRFEEPGGPLRLTGSAWLVTAVR